MRGIPGVLPEDDARRLISYGRELRDLLPGLVAKVFLFGSRARGDGRPDSDFDVAVLLAQGQARNANVRSSVADATFVHVIDGFALAPAPLPDDYLDPVDGHYRTELARRIAREGLEVG